MQKRIANDQSMNSNKLPLIASAESKQYKTKLAKIESKTNTGLNLTNQDSKNNCINSLEK